jgi:thiamine pyrophosphate-dependent acetolactate synthase large subunit-like protein
VEEIERTGGEAVVQTLAAHGVRHVFGIPGVHNLAIYDALIRAGRDGLPPAHLLVRHEQSAVYAADGYARAAGRPGVALVTTGPGALNAIAALNESACSDVPVLVIASQIHSQLLGAGRGALHETKDQTGVLRAVIDYAVSVQSGDEIPLRIAEAFRWMAFGSRRPAAVEIPHDFLSGPCRAGAPPLPAESVEYPCVETLAGVIAAVRASRYPLILAGGGVTHAGADDALVRLAERLAAPVITTSAAKGAIPAGHPLHVGVLAAGGSITKILTSADLVIAVGTRMSHRDLRRVQAPPPPALIHVDTDPSVFGRTWRASLEVKADARAFLEALAEGLAMDPPRDVGPAQDRVWEVRREQREKNRVREPLAMEYMAAIGEALGEDGILSADQTVIGYWCELEYPCARPRTFLYPAGSGGLGYALPAALGAKVAFPERHAAVVIGDGGLHFTIGDFASLVQHRQGVPVLVFNDNQYGVIRYLQVQTYRRSGEVDLVNPDFPALGRVYGAVGVRVVDPSRLTAAMAEAFTRDVPTLIEVPCSLVPPW